MKLVAVSVRHAPARSTSRLRRPSGSWQRSALSTTPGVHGARMVVIQWRFDKTSTVRSNPGYDGRKLLSMSRTKTSGTAVMTTGVATRSQGPSDIPNAPATETITGTSEAARATPPVRPRTTMDGPVPAHPTEYSGSRGEHEHGDGSHVTAAWCSSDGSSHRQDEVGGPREWNRDGESVDGGYGNRHATWKRNGSSGTPHNYDNTRDYHDGIGNNDYADDNDGYDNDYYDAAC
ncbi:unnamed protein product [Phytophthora fragariaefolia]|uniref:Unnamed protein product n=1 Tax=Phytophthora fragariaefolia TaxID=1490495 RepID=A0A9W6XED8_9STRA|nr:unnamed protein product [Phytophthora fragariaefolia]